MPGPGRNGFRLPEPDQVVCTGGSESGTGALPVAA